MPISPETMNEPPVACSKSSSFNGFFLFSSMIFPFKFIDTKITILFLICKFQTYQNHASIVSKHTKKTSMSPTERLSVRRKNIEASGYTYSSLNIFTFPLAHFLFFAYLRNVLFPQPPHARKRMKRESGESPEQSRCCKPHLHRLSLLNSPGHCLYIKVGRQSKQR